MPLRIKLEKSNVIVHSPLFCFSLKIVSMSANLQYLVALAEKMTMEKSDEYTIIFPLITELLVLASG